MLNKQSMLDLAELVDAFRVVPRISVAMYGLMMFQVTIWFMGLDAPTTQQSTFISIVYGAAAGFFGFYLNSSRDWTPKNTK